MSELAFGIDIGGTDTKWGLVSESGELLYESSQPTKNAGSVEEFVAELSVLMKKSLKEQGQGGELKGIGIGTPNGNYLTGRIELAPNLPWGDDVPIAELFEKEFSVPVKVSNDANVAAAGELRYGKYDPPLEDFILITLGTGLGAGIVVNGQLLHGAHGMAAELGHVQAFDDGRLCGCGLKGCLEAYVSATGMRHTFFELLEKTGAESKLKDLDPDEVDLKMIFDAAKEGDKTARETFRWSGELLGKRLANSVAHTQPKVILLCGGVMKGQELFLKEAQESLEKALFPVYRGKVTIEPTSSGGKNMAVLGAAALIW